MDHVGFTVEDNWESMEKAERDGEAEGESPLPEDYEDI